MESNNTDHGAGRDPQKAYDSPSGPGVVSGSWGAISATRPSGQCPRIAAAPAHPWGHRRKLGPSGLRVTCLPPQPTRQGGHLPHKGHQEPRDDVAVGEPLRCVEFYSSWQHFRCLECPMFRAPLSPASKRPPCNAELCARRFVCTTSGRCSMSGTAGCPR